jgi:hypothetical protein
MHDRGPLPPDGYVVAVHAVTDNDQIGRQLFPYRPVATWDETWDLAQETRQAEGLHCVHVFWVRRRGGHHAAHGDLPVRVWSAQPPEPTYG